VGPRIHLEKCGDDVMLPIVFDTSHVEAVASCYTDCAISAPLVCQYRIPSTVRKRIELSVLLKYRACRGVWPTLVPAQEAQSHSVRLAVFVYSVCP